jgi:hypothetical protein
MKLPECIRITFFFDGELANIGNHGWPTKCGAAKRKKEANNCISDGGAVGEVISVCSI